MTEIIEYEMRGIIEPKYAGVKVKITIVDGKVTYVEDLYVEEYNYLDKELYVPGTKFPEEMVEYAYRAIRIRNTGSI